MKKIFLVIFLTLLFPAGLAAYGPHDNECVECHAIHEAQGEALIAEAPFQPENPNTGTPVTDASSLCLACHSEEGGVLEISLMKTHPIGITPKKAQVPPERLSVDGTMMCISCHDQHPSNPNYKYLRAPVTGPGDMGLFCEMCHPDKRER